MATEGRETLAARKNTAVLDGLKSINRRETRIITPVGAEATTNTMTEGEAEEEEEEGETILLRETEEEAKGITIAEVKEAWMIEGRRLKTRDTLGLRWTVETGVEVRGRETIVWREEGEAITTDTGRERNRWTIGGFLSLVDHLHLLNIILIFALSTSNYRIGRVCSVFIISCHSCDNDAFM